MTFYSAIFYKKKEDGNAPLRWKENFIAGKLGTKRWGQYIYYVVLIEVNLDVHSGIFQKPSVIKFK